jgi:hypothetical protein
MNKDYKKTKKRILKLSESKFRRLQSQPQKYCDTCGNWKYMASRRGRICYDCMTPPARSRFFREGMKK